MAKVNKLDIKKGKFTPETVYDNDHYYTDENGHIRPKPEYKTPEKEYKFIECSGPGKEKHFIVKESDLSQQQKDLLLGDLIHQFNNLPDILKHKALHAFVEALEK